MGSSYMADMRSIELYSSYYYISTPLWKLILPAQEPGLAQTQQDLPGADGAEEGGSVAWLSLRDHDWERVLPCHTSQLYRRGQEG